MYYTYTFHEYTWMCREFTPVDEYRKRIDVLERSRTPNNYFAGRSIGATSTRIERFSKGRTLLARPLARSLDFDAG